MAKKINGFANYGNFIPIDKFIRVIEPKFKIKKPIMIHFEHFSLNYDYIVGIRRAYESFSKIHGKAKI